MNGSAPINTSSEANPRRKILLVTLDPANGGGILAMMQAAYRIAESAGYEPYIAYNRIPSLRGEKEKHGLRSLAAEPSFREEEFRGMRGFAVDRVLPEFEFLNYSGNIKAWEQILSRFERWFVVGGNALAALPLFYTRRAYAIWLATPLYEDRLDRMRHEGLLRNLRDRISLPFLLRQEKRALQGARKILALSDYTKESLAGKFPEIQTKIEVMSFPVDTELFAPGPGAGGMEMIFTGRVEDPRKNIPMLLEALALAQKELPQLKLQLVGGHLNPDSQAALRKYGLEKQVEVLPPEPREGLRLRYAQAALFVLPSLQEGLCIAGLEALASGLPVISTKCGGPEEFVADGVNGYLVPNNNPAAFAEAITRFFRMSEAERAKMREAARATALERYSFKNTAPKMAANFQNG